MLCPREIADVLLKILYMGILSARAAGWSGDAARAAREADHIHNLPGLLADYSPDRLAYYWDAERPAYLDAGGTAARFQELWDQLWRHVEAISGTSRERDA